MSRRENTHWLRHLLRRIKAVLSATIAFWTSPPVFLAAVTGVVLLVLALGTERALTWMETPGFCGQCHTMGAQVEAHERSPHQTVECTECHTSRGLDGFIKSKWDGMVQMVKLTTGRYARPIEPAAHSIPPVGETCLRCHDPARQRGDLLITRSHFSDDEQNTEQRVALVVRLTGDPDQQTRGIHWHVQSNVEYLARDEGGQIIDWIGVEYPDGSREEFIAQDVVVISEQAGQRAAELRSSGRVRRMDCFDCHNRVGHSFLTPTRALDEALDDGWIDRGIPFIKKRALDVLNAEYTDLEDADGAIRRLGDWYHQNYPNVFLERPDSLGNSLGALARVYREVADPDMLASADAYPSYLGHTDSSGCFRCHDGGHFKIEDGAMSDEAIPSRCSLCHTFPSVGEEAPNVMLGPSPSSHSGSLWVFDHSDQAPSLAPEAETCGACHSATYCSNCHSTGAVEVTHDNMLYDHAAVIRDTGDELCSYCHQKPSCERCHQGDLDP